MARINKKVKLFIVRLMAEFETPTDAVRQVKDIFGVDVTPQQCEAYDPTKRTGQDLAQELRNLFFEYRRQANQEIEAIPIANKRYRLQRLQNIIDHDQFKNNPVLVPKMLEQAAKEVGGLFTNTNKTELTGANGQNLNPEQVTHVVATPEQIRQVLNELEGKY